MKHFKTNRITFILGPTPVVYIQHVKQRRSILKFPVARGVLSESRCKITADSDTTNVFFSWFPKHRPTNQRLSEIPSDIALLALKNALKNCLTIFFLLNASLGFGLSANVQFGYLPSTLLMVS